MISNGKIAAFVDLYKTNQHEISIEKLNDLAKEKLNRALLDHPEGVVIIRGSTHFLHMILPDNTIDGMGASLNDSFTAGTDYYHLLGNEWSILRL